MYNTTEMAICTIVDDDRDALAGLSKRPSLFMVSMVPHCCHAIMGAARSKILDAS